METRKLGSSDLDVTVVGLGCNNFGGRIDEAASRLRMEIDSMPAELDEVRQRLRDGFDPARTWVIEVGGTFAGCVALRPDGGTRWLEHFYLAPHLQGRGLGSAVLRALLHAVRQRSDTSPSDPVPLHPK